MRTSLLLAAVAVLSLPASLAHADAESGQRIQLSVAGGSVENRVSNYNGGGGGMFAYGDAHTFVAADLRYGYAPTRYFEVDVQARVDALDAEPGWVPMAALGARISPVHFGASDVGIRFALGAARMWHPYRPEQTFGSAAPRYDGGLASVGLDTRIGLRPGQQLTVGSELTAASFGANTTDTYWRSGYHLTAGLRVGVVFSL